MRKFVFRLETLLQHRIRLEEKERNKFSLMRAELLAELNYKDSLQIRQNNTRSELTSKKSGAYNAQEISWYYLFLDRLEHQIQQSIKKADQLKNNLETQKQVMIGASRNKQMIENLKQKKQREYGIALDREDQKFIDEIVVTRFAHRP